MKMMCIESVALESDMTESNTLEKAILISEMNKRIQHYSTV